MILILNTNNKPFLFLFKFSTKYCTAPTKISNKERVLGRLEKSLKEARSIDNMQVGIQ